jgi:hypothetical protein
MEREVEGTRPIDFPTTRSWRDSVGYLVLTRPGRPLTTEMNVNIRRQGIFRDTHYIPYLPISPFLGCLQLNCLLQLNCKPWRYTLE